MVVTKDMWQDWKRHPVTLKYLEDLHHTREGLKEGLAEGQSSSEREDCINMGRTQGLKDALEYALKTFDFVELIEEEDGAKSDSL